MYVETRGNQRITTRTGAFVTDRAGDQANGGFQH